MNIPCVWEHNGNDSLLYAVNLPGVYSRGPCREIALGKLAGDAVSYLRWLGLAVPEEIRPEIAEDVPSGLQICDADSDVLFTAEKEPLSAEAYEALKATALKSAADFLKLYESIPDKNKCGAPARETFYGQVPRTAEEMYQHTKNVNRYYFGEIGVEADNAGTILHCRARGFEKLETMPDFLANPVFVGSYDESWTLRKILRRFIWHDRIHAKAMYRMGVTIFGPDAVPNVFCF